MKITTGGSQQQFSSSVMSRKKLSSVHVCVCVDRGYERTVEVVNNKHVCLRKLSFSLNFRNSVYQKRGETKTPTKPNSPGNMLKRKNTKTTVTFAYRLSGCRGETRDKSTGREMNI